MEERFPPDESENIEKRLQKLFILMISTKVDESEVDFLEIRNRVTQLYDRTKSQGEVVSRQVIEEIIEDVRLYLDILNGEDNDELQKFKSDFGKSKF
jgi:hypothetical protein